MPHSCACKPVNTSLHLQLDSDDENEPAAGNVPAVQRRAAERAERDPNSLEDDLSDEDATACGGDAQQGQSGAAAVDRQGQNGAAPPRSVGAGAAAVKMRQDYRAWIAARKGAWRAHRLAKRGGAVARGGSGATAAVGAAEAAGLGALGGGLQRQMAAMLHATWQIVQVRALRCSAKHLLQTSGVRCAARCVGHDVQQIASVQSVMLFDLIYMVQGEQGLMSFQTLATHCCPKAEQKSLLQVAPGSKPGALEVWALIDTAMHRITVNVPRTLYVDVAFEHSHLLAGARQVHRTLPDGSQPATLLELSMPEEEFLEHAPVCTRTQLSALLQSQ